MPGGELLYPSLQHQPATPPQQPHPTIITTAKSELLEDETWVWSKIKAEARRDAESEPDLASSYYLYNRKFYCYYLHFDLQQSLTRRYTLVLLFIPSLQRTGINLRDIIANQIQINQDCPSRQSVKVDPSLGSSLIQNQCALQQLKRKGHHLWRPQRSLPEKSVPVLRAWMFKNFIREYVVVCGSEDDLLSCMWLFSGTQMMRKSISSQLEVDCKEPAMQGD